MVGGGPIRLAHLATLALWGVLPVAAGAAGEEGIARIVLNEVDRGDYRFVLADGDLEFASEDLLGMGFSALPRGFSAAPGVMVPLGAYFPPVFVEFDARTSTLRVRADPSLLGRRVVDLAPAAPTGVIARDEAASVLNYGVQWGGSSFRDEGTVWVPGELVIRAGGCAAISDLSYTRTRSFERWVRGMSAVVRDVPERNLRLVLGDTLATSGPFGSSLALAGLSASTQFSMSPMLQTRPGLDVGGALRTQSDVEFYVNDVLIRRERFPPGEFEFKNLPNVLGAADVTIVVRDAFGRETRVSSSAYLASQLLAPGIQELGYSAGWRRLELGVESFRYGRPVLLAFHRAGWTRWFTAGARAEGDAETINAGVNVATALGPLGELDLEGAASRDRGRGGRAGSATWLYAAKRFNVGATVRAMSRDYARLTLPWTGDKPAIDGSVSLGLRLTPLGTLSVSHQVSKPYQLPNRARTSAFYSRSLARWLSLQVMASRTAVAGREAEYEVTAMLTALLGRGTSGAVRGAWRDDALGAAVNVQRNAPLGPGWGYRVAGATDEDRLSGNRTWTGRAAGEYHGPFHVVTAEYQEQRGARALGASVAGALVLIDDSLHAARPVRDAFALVWVGRLRGVTVKLNHQEVGETGTGGALLVPGLTSYFPDELAIDDTGLPVDYTVGETAKRVAAAYRGGGQVRFDVRRLQAFTGRVVLLDRAARTVPEFWGLELRAGDAKVETVIGRGGELYLENVPPGAHPARLFTQGAECSFALRIPESGEVLVDLGEVTCEVP